MTKHKTVILWLLQQAGIADTNQAIVGDLLEEWSSGRSASWFWRQTLIIIAVHGFNDLCRHKLLALS